MDPDYNPTCIQEQSLIQKFHQKWANLNSNWLKNPRFFRDKQLYHGNGSRLQSYLPILSFLSPIQSIISMFGYSLRNQAAGNKSDSMMHEELHQWNLAESKEQLQTSKDPLCSKGRNGRKRTWLYVAAGSLMRQSILELSATKNIYLQTVYIPGES
jgi:hypothetical protein